MVVRRPAATDRYVSFGSSGHGSADADRLRRARGSTAQLLNCSSTRITQN
jgi:hypothetical protein